MSFYLLARSDLLCPPPPPPPPHWKIFHSCLAFCPMQWTILLSWFGSWGTITSAVHRGWLGRGGGVLFGAIWSFINDPSRCVSHVKLNICFRSHMSNHTALYFRQILHWDKWFFTHETHSRVRHWRVVGTIAGWLPSGWDIRLQRSVGHSGVVGGGGRLSLVG